MARLPRPSSEAGRLPEMATLVLEPRQIGLQMSNNIGRRDFLGTVVLVGAAAAAGRTSLINSAEAATASSDGITSASASELAEAVRSKKWSCKEIVEAHLDRIAKVNPKLNAVVQLTAEAARKEADEADAALARGEIKGPLHGVPVTIKDTLETAGVICTGGTKGRANYVPKADATAVARLRAAGGIILGKTNVPELAGAAETDNLVYGRTNNPYNRAHAGRQQRRRGRDHCRRRLAARSGHRCRWQHPHPGALLRARGHQADLGPRAADRAISDATWGAQSGVSRQPDRAKGRGSGPGVADCCGSRFPRSLDRGNAARRPCEGGVTRFESGLFRRRWRRDADKGNRRCRAGFRQGIHRCRGQGRGKPAARRGKTWRRLFRYQPRRRRCRHAWIPQEHRNQRNLADVRKGAGGCRGTRDARHDGGPGRVCKMGFVPQFDAALH